MGKGSSQAILKDTPMSNKPTKNGTLADRLSRDSEINITVTGRKSGRSITLPIWFVWDDKLYLLPVKGSDTQWYKNVLKNRTMRIDARGAGTEIKPALVTDAKGVSSIVERFRGKYGVGDVKKYYSKFDVGIVADIR